MDRAVFLITGTWWLRIMNHLLANRLRAVRPARCMVRAWLKKREVWLQLEFFFLVEIRPARLPMDKDPTKIAMGITAKTCVLNDTAVSR